MKTIAPYALLLMVLAACDATPTPLPSAQSEEVSAVAEQTLVTAFAAGSIIIPTDNTSQDNGTLRSFGLVYRLLQANVPVNRIALTGKDAGSVIDFSANVIQRQTDAGLGNVDYRAGPFVIDVANAVAALPIIDAFQQDGGVNVHVATAPFNADVRQTLVAAPRIAVFEDGYQTIAYGYLNAAAIRDPLGNVWTNASPSAFTIAQVAGTGDGGRTNGDGGFDGVLFNVDGTTAYDQLTSMHYDAPGNTEAIREVRGWLSSGPNTHAFMQCEAITTFENDLNGRFLTDVGLADDGAAITPINLRQPDTLFTQYDGTLQSDNGAVDSFGLAAGSTLHTNSSILIDRAGSPITTRMMWLTGFVDGDPAKGKVSYLGGHDFSVTTPISTHPQTNGVRLFLDSLFEIGGLTSTGVPLVTVTKSAPLRTNAVNYTYTLNYSNTGQSTALTSVLTDVLPAGTTFVSATGGGINASNTVTWALGNLAAAASGSVTVTVSALEGTYSNTATMAFKASNTPKTSSSNTTSTLVDRTAPSAPVVTAPANGSSTANTTPTYSGTAEANSTVTVSAGGSVVCTITATAMGDWSCVQPTALGDQAYVLNATATDATGNVSLTSNSNIFTIDTVAPAAPAVTAPANSSFVTTTTPAYSGTAEPNSSVRVYVDTVLLCTTAASAGGTFGCTPATVLAQGPHQVYATSTDAAGNTSVNSNTNSFTVDSTPPAAPVVQAPANGSQLTTRTPVYSGTAEPGSTVTVRFSITTVCTAIADASTGVFTCSSSTPLADGTYIVNAVATDAAGNTSLVSTLNTFIVDATAPAVPVISTPANGNVSSNTTPTYSGTAEAGSSVQVLVDNVVYCTVTATGGTFSCPQVAALSNGDHTVNATATDSAGNMSQVSSTNTFTVDTAAPAKPIVTGPTNNGATNDTTPAYTGTAEANSTVRVTVDGSLVCTTTASASGAFSCNQPGPGLAVGSHTVTANATDAAGNTSPFSDTNTFTIDTTPPAKPVITLPANASVVSTGSPAFSGTAETGATVRVIVDGNEVCTAVATTGDVFSCTPMSAIADGTHSVNVTATDPAGNLSPVSDNHSFTIDTGVPIAPVVSAPANGSSSSNTSPTYTGTAEAGSTVKVIVDGALVCTVTATGGTFSCSGTTPLSDATHTVNATSTDAAGNVSPVSPTHSFTVDTVAPETTIVSGPAAQSPSTTARFTFSSDEPGATFECSLDAAAFAACTNPVTFSGLTLGSHTLQVRAVDAAGNIDATPAEQTWVVAPDLDTTIVSGPMALSRSASAAFTFSSNTSNVTYDCSVDGGAFVACPAPTIFMALGDGSHTLRVRARDAFGNVDTTPALQTWVIDTVPPAAPIITTPLDGASVTPSVVITGTGEPNSTVTVVIDGMAAGTTAVDGAGAWTFTPPMPLTTASHTISATATDPAGNLGPSSVPIQVTVDPTAIDTSIVTGPSGKTNSANATFTFSSTAANASYECSLDAAAFSACPSPVTFNALSEGTHTLTVRAKDASGTLDATPDTRTWFIDTVPPGAPVVSSPAHGSTIGTTTPIIRGSAEAGSTITVLIDGMPAGTTMANPQGEWTFTPSPELTPGNHTVAARATDASGNPSADSTPNGFIIDTSVLDTFIVSGPSSVSPLTSAAFDLASNRAGALFECNLDGAGFTACIDPATFSSLADGSHTLQVRAKDDLGNVDASPASFTWVVDTQAPAAPVVTAPADGSSSMNTRPVLTGTAEPGAKVAVTLDGQFAGTVQANSMGTWSLPLTTNLPDGEHRVSATATDLAGNQSPNSAANVFTVMTGGLLPPVITSPSNGSTVGSATPAVTGKAPPNSTVTVSIDGAVAGMVAADANGDWALTPSAPLINGTHVITATANRDGTTTSSSAPVTIQVDAVNIETTIASSPNDGNSGPANFSFTSNVTGSSFECSLDGAAYTACGATSSLTNVAAGSHTLSVRAVAPNGAKDTTPATATWVQAASTVDGGNDGGSTAGGGTDGGGTGGGGGSGATDGGSSRGAQRLAGGGCSTTAFGPLSLLMLGLVFMTWSRSSRRSS